MDDLSDDQLCNAIDDIGNVELAILYLTYPIWVISHLSFVAPLDVDRNQPRISRDVVPVVNMIWVT